MQKPVIKSNGIEALKLKPGPNCWVLEGRKGSERTRCTTAHRLTGLGLVLLQAQALRVAFQPSLALFSESLREADTTKTG